MSKLSIRLQGGAGCAGARPPSPPAFGPAVRPKRSKDSSVTSGSLRAGPAECSFQRPSRFLPAAWRPWRGLGCRRRPLSPSAASCGSCRHGSGSEWRTWRRRSPAVRVSASRWGRKASENKGVAWSGESSGVPMLTTPPGAARWSVATRQTLPVPGHAGACRSSCHVDRVPAVLGPGYAEWPRSLVGCRGRQLRAHSGSTAATGRETRAVRDRPRAGQIGESRTSADQENSDRRTLDRSFCAHHYWRWRIVRSPGSSHFVER